MGINTQSIDRKVLKVLFIVNVYITNGAHNRIISEKIQMIGLKNSNTKKEQEVEGIAIWYTKLGNQLQLLRCFDDKSKEENCFDRIFWH